jgi:hypothetical protein
MYIFSHGRGGVEWYISIDTSEKIMSIQIYKLNDIVIFEDKITIGSTSYVNYGDDNTCFKFSLSVDSYIFKSKDDIVNYFNYVVQILISIETLINCVKNLSQHIFNQTKIEINKNTVFAENVDPPVYPSTHEVSGAARYVRINLLRMGRLGADDRVLNLAEVEVFGR